jgi:hypothetical protein
MNEIMRKDNIYILGFSVILAISGNNRIHNLALFLKENQE